MAVKCWANTLGSCGKQSREHFISKGLWSGDTIGVRGLWAEERIIGLDSLTTKNLCKPHNEQLSPLDSAAKHVFSTIEEVYRLYDVRLRLKKTNQWTVIRYEVDGNLFERWAAKFLVGFSYVVAKDRKWHDTRTGPLDPPVDVVKAIFGVIPFEEPMGLYSAFDVGDEQYMDDGIAIEPLFHPDDKGLVGANMDFKGFRFIIWLSNTNLDNFDIPASGGRIFGPNGSEPMYRVKHERFEISKVLSQVLTFKWQ